MNKMLSDFSRLPLADLPTPCFVVDEVAVEKNLKVLHDVQQKSGAKILHALKAFSMFSLAPLTSRYLSGTCSSGINEALLAKEFYEGEIHVFSPAYTEEELKQLLDFAHHIVFNSCGQLLRFADLCKQAKNKRPELHFGLRINPEHSEGEHAIYDPCAPKSRLGTTKAQLENYLKQEKFQEVFSLISGFHFHSLCEQDFLPLERTLNAFELGFSQYFSQLKWLNFGGGHHITREDYQREALISRVNQISEKYAVQVYLEPGEAVAIGTGVLVAEVLDITFNEVNQAIINTSATCHMPDTLEMPYRPDIMNAGKPCEKKILYRFGGMTCLAGDVMGEYSFDKPLSIGDKIIFEDMAHYTMVKTSTFNGALLPSIAIWNSETGKISIQKTFGYHDFKNRLS